MPVPNPWRSPSDQAYLDQWLQQWKARQPKGYVPKPGWEDRVLAERRQTHAAQGAAAPPAQPPARPDTSQRVPVNTPGVPYVNPFSPQPQSSLLTRPSTAQPFVPTPMRPSMPDPVTARPTPGSITQQPMASPPPPPPPMMAPGGGFRSLAPGTVPAGQWMGGGREMEPARQIQQHQPMNSPAPVNQLGQGISQAMTSMVNPQGLAKAMTSMVNPQGLAKPLGPGPTFAPSPYLGGMNTPLAPRPPTPNDRFAQADRDRLLALAQSRVPDGQPQLRRLF